MALSLGFGSTSSSTNENASGSESGSTVESGLSNTNQTTNSNVNSNTNQRDDTKTSRLSDGTVDLSSVLSTLDEGTQERLKELFASIGDPTQLGSLSTALSERALNADAELQAGIDSIVSEARATGEKAVGRATAGAGRTAGSTQNTIVQQLGIEGQVDLESKLASLAGELGLQRRQIATAELTGAAGQQTTAIQTIADLLKGSTQITDQTQKSENSESELSTALSELISTSSTEEVLSALVESLTKGNTTTEFNEQAGSSTGSSSAGIGIG